MTAQQHCISKISEVMMLRLVAENLSIKNESSKAAW